MPRHVAIYKCYDSDLGLQRGKDYRIISKAEGTTNSIQVTVLDSNNEPVASLVYSAEWEFLRDWQILRTWKGKN